MMNIGDRVLACDTDGFGIEGAWLPGTVYAVLKNGKYRISCDCAGMLDVDDSGIKYGGVSEPVDTSPCDGEEMGPAPIPHPN